MLKAQSPASIIRELIERNPNPDARMRAYIADLVRLESFIHAEGPQSFRAGIDFYFLKTRYEREYIEMLHELKPEFARKVGESWTFFFQ